MAKKQEFDASSVQLGQQDDILLVGVDEPDHNRVKGMDPAILHKRYLDALAFMEEEMTIIVNETTDKNAENPVFAGVNGQQVYFPRGIPCRTKRKFVDSLIVKSTNVSTPEIQLQNGERSFAIRQTSSLKYPFMVIEDKNPKGNEWLRGRLAELV